MCLKLSLELKMWKQCNLLPLSHELKEISISKLTKEVQHTDLNESPILDGLLKLKYFQIFMFSIPLRI